MNARFYAPDADTSGAVVALPEEESEHLMRVLRLTVGDAVTVFNGRGAEFHANVESVNGRHVAIRVADPAPAAPETLVAITLAQAVLKGDKMDDVVRDAVMIGVAAIRPLLTVRTEVSRTTLERSRRQQRWQRIAIASAKQCGRAVVPPVLDPLDFAGLPGAVAELQLPGPALMFVEPRATDDTTALGELPSMAPREATIVIGPEGGWAPDEIAAASGACRLITLGGRTIRADAMAAIAVAALLTKWNEF